MRWIPVFLTVAKNQFPSYILGGQSIEAVSMSEKQYENEAVAMTDWYEMFGTGLSTSGLRPAKN